MSLRNVGAASAGNVSARISTADTLVTVLRDSAFFGTIAPSVSAIRHAAYRASALSSAQDGHWVRFTLTANSGANQWVSYFNMMGMGIWRVVKAQKT